MRRFRPALRVAAAAAVVLAGLLAVPGAGWSEPAPLAGSAGTDTALPLTDSALTLRGRAAFADLAVTVNQTRDLANQAVSVTWRGGVSSTGFGRNWLQIFQCWGDDDGTRPDNPGPPPEHCQFGGEPIGTSVTSKIPAGTPPSNVYTRRVTQDNWSTFDPATRRCGVGAPAATDCYDSRTGAVWKPFQAVNGTIVETQYTLRPTSEGSQVSVEWQNPFFDAVTTNEDPWGRTYGNGTGAELVEVATGLEARGLGCGQRVVAGTDGRPAMPRCWLVVVPRGTPDEENPLSVRADFHHVAVSPLAPTAWRNRIAFPLEFNPVDVGCSIGADQRRIVGSELAGPAVVNWQPTLCATPGLPPYAYQAIGDDSARRQLLTRAAGAAGMAVFSSPLDVTATADDPVVYAPLTLSGAVIGFNVERVPTDYDGVVRDPAEGPLRGVRVAHLNLTPRLVAKLLTQSYASQFLSLSAADPPSGYAWVRDSRSHLFADPDFLRFNPEFAVMSVGSLKTAAGLVVAAPTADAATETWRWVLADPEARAWLGGAPDQWGMRVNPYYSTDRAANPTHNPFADPVPNQFPRNDPYCYHAPPVPGRDLTPRPLCSLDISPFALTLEQAAREVRAANDGAQTTHNPDDPTHQTATTWWSADGPQPLGSRSLLAVTDAASAARYGLQTASLSRAGDDGDTRAFVAPDQGGLLAGRRAMVPTSTAGVLRPDPATTVAGAYPLTMLTYAAVAPAALDDAARRDYAALLDYAAAAGQVPGSRFGQLPVGYAPLPDDLRTATRAAADAIRRFTPAARAEEPAPTPAPTPGAGVVAEPTTTRAEAPMPTPTTAAAAAPAPVPTPTSARHRAGATASPVPTVPPVPAALRRSVPASSHGTTPGLVAGLVRLAVPVAAALSLGAFLAVLLLDDRWFRRTTLFR